MESEDREVRTLIASLMVLEGLLGIYRELWGESKARELLEKALLKAENTRQDRRLSLARYIAELRPQ